MDKKEIIIPEGWEIESAKDGKIILVEKLKEFPETWEEYCHTQEGSNKYIIEEACEPFLIDNIIPFPPKESKNYINTEDEVHSFLAWMQLIQLRDYYRRGWVPDWSNDDQDKWCIYVDKSLHVRSYYVNAAGNYTQKDMLVFPMETMADEFIRNFKDLILKAYSL